MKEKIVYLIIGILIGAIITTIGFYFYNKNHKMHNPQVGRENFQMMQEGREFGPKGNRNGEIPLEKPDAAGADGQEQMVPPEINGQTTTESQNITSSTESTNNES